MNISSHDQQIIDRALSILEERAKYGVEDLSSPSSVRNYLRLRIGLLEREEFWVVWLDAQNRAISFEQMFVGTLTQTSVYPREIVKAALKHNAASAILAHNHPSGLPEPSNADVRLTRHLKDALAMVDVRVIDHFVIGGATMTSFAERGMI